jgi:hypothetical protein
LRKDEKDLLIKNEEDDINEWCSFWN